MSRSDPPRSSIAEKVRHDSASAGPAAVHRRSWRRRLFIRCAAVTLWLHIYLSMFGLAALLFFGVTGGNMDSMVNRYTADRRLRSDDAYTPGVEGGKRPDRCTIVYAQRCREAYKDTPIILGGIEASLRRIAHFDYWSEKVRRSILLDAKADLLIYGNAERQICELAHRLAKGEPLDRKSTRLNSSHRSLSRMPSSA